MQFSVFLLLAIALSMDAFTAAFSYGIEKVRVPFLSVLIIAVISGLMLSVSLLAGNLVLNIVPVFITKFISFTVLLFLALCKLFPYLPRKKIKDKESSENTLTQKINKDDKSILSSGEAALLALALSIDNITAGISSGIADLSPFPIFIFAILIHVIAFKSGGWLGLKVSGITSRNFSWVGGVLLLFLAILRII